MPEPAWKQQRERDELVARKAKDAAAADPDLESAVIAYHAYRVGGGTGGWQEFRREWLTKREAG
jgi:hypothetical protein